MPVSQGAPGRAREPIFNDVQRAILRRFNEVQKAASEDPSIINLLTHHKSRTRESSFMRGLASYIGSYDDKPRR